MRRLIWLATAAFSCSGLNATFAQIQILGSGQPTLAPRLVSEQNDFAELEALPLGSESPSNLFDFFSDDLPSVPPHAPALSDREDSATIPSNKDPSSLPVATHPPRSIIETIVNEATIASIASASTTTVDWGTGPLTPNPVAQWLMREHCVEGLWSGYQAQRDAECAAMWHHLSGHSRCGATPCAVSGPCTACAPHKPRNRYTEHLAPACSCRLNAESDCHVNTQSIGYNQLDAPSVERTYAPTPASEGLHSRGNVATLPMPALH